MCIFILNNKVAKPNDYLNQCKKSIWQNSISIQNKNSERSKNIRELPHSDTGYL